MKKNRIMTLVLAAAVLAVITSGSASAATWNYQTDTTEYWGSNPASWYSWIDMSGQATVGQSLSWYNALNNKVIATVKPKIKYFEDLNGDGSYTERTNTYYSTLNRNQAWSVIENTQDKVGFSSARDIWVWHDYYDASGNSWLASSPSKSHVYTI